MMRQLTLKEEEKKAEIMKEKAGGEPHTFHYPSLFHEEMT